MRGWVDSGNLASLPEESRMEAFVAKYAEEEEHRTGSTGGRASAESLAQLLRDASNGKATVSLQQFEFPRRMPNDSHVNVQLADGSSWSATGFPMLDGGYTDGDGIAGSLGFPGTDCDVALVNYTDTSTPLRNPSWKEAAANRRHKAILAVYKPQNVGGPSGLALVNAQNFPSNVGKPVLLVDGSFLGMLEKEAARGAQVELVVTVTEEEAKAINVQAELLGSDPALAPVLIMTPRSGWWRCATERATGIAAWVEILRSISASQPRRSVYFLATDGHELSHIGGKYWLHSRPGFMENAHLIMHIGANWGSKIWAKAEPVNLLQAGEPELRDRALKALIEVGFNSSQVLLMHGNPVGEASEIAQKTQRFVSLIGLQNPYFHLEGDTANILDVEILKRQLSVFRSLALRAVLDGSKL